MIYIYESPKGERRRSGPVHESETARRAWLEARGWRVVETRATEAPQTVYQALTQLAETPSLANVSGEADGVRLAGDERLDFLSEDQRASLHSAGFASEADLRAASDEDLRAVKGIGPAAVRDIRKALSEP
jgi:DNA uptake protein ComE-like DNA-binding protein